MQGKIRHLISSTYWQSNNVMNVNSNFGKFIGPRIVNMLLVMHRISTLEFWKTDNNGDGNNNKRSVTKLRSWYVKV